MRGWTGAFAVTITAATLLLGADPAAAVDAATARPELTWDDAPAVAFDVGLLRPLSAVATIAGVPFFLASAPFAAISGDLMASWDVFVLAPYDYTVRRKLADF